MTTIENIQTIQGVQLVRGASGRVKIIVTVINDGATPRLGVDDFRIFINGRPATNNTYMTVRAGTVVCTYTPEPDYAASIWGANADAGGHITLAAGESKTATITFNDIP